MQNYYKSISFSIIFMDFIIEIVFFFFIIYCHYLANGSNLLKRLEDFSESFIVPGESFQNLGTPNL